MFSRFGTGSSSWQQATGNRERWNQPVPTHHLSSPPSFSLLLPIRNPPSLPPQPPPESAILRPKLVRLIKEKAGSDVYKVSPGFQRSDTISTLSWRFKDKKEAVEPEADPERDQ